MIFFRKLEFSPGIPMDFFPENFPTIISQNGFFENSSSDVFMQVIINSSRNSFRKFSRHLKILHCDLSRITFVEKFLQQLLYKIFLKLFNNSFRISFGNFPAIVSKISPKISSKFPMEALLEIFYIIYYMDYSGDCSRNFFRKCFRTATMDSFQNSCMDNSLKIFSRFNLGNFPQTPKTSSPGIIQGNLAWVASEISSFFFFEIHS